MKRGYLLKKENAKFYTNLIPSDMYDENVKIDTTSELFG